MNSTRAEQQTDKPPVVWGVFDDEARLLEAIRSCRHAGQTIADVYSPYAVHGLEHVAGFRRSRMHRAAFVFGSLGVLCALGLQYWTTAVSWPINVGNKPWNSWPAFIPVTFEMTVLFAGVGTVLVFLALARLWPGRKAEMPFAGLTDDRFALGVCTSGKDGAHVEAEDLETMLRRHGAIQTTIDPTAILPTAEEPS
jgi:hypothetical protein